jgi:SAM-dependent methyltransferase
MAHKEQREFFEELNLRFSRLFSSANRVFEVGSQNINGTVRDFFPNAREYLGIDLGMAPDVDWVIPGELAELSDGWADIVISTECFEHCDNWHLVFLNMARILASGGLFVFTSAGTGRAAHGTIDSDEYSSPFTTSYYKNLDVDQVAEKIKLGCYFDSHGFEVNSKSGDLYFWGIRSGLAFDEIESHWSSPLDRLARAQGQLAQAASRHIAMTLQCAQAREEADQARSEADQAREEADQAREEADQARAEADQARAEADQARAEADQARAEADQARTEADNMSLNFRKIKESRTWRLTGIIRTVLDKIKRLI